MENEEHKPGYCDVCGKQLVKATRQLNRYHTNTGEAIYWQYYKCPTPNKRGFFTPRLSNHRAYALEGIKEIETIWADEL